MYLVGPVGGSRNRMERTSMNAAQERRLDAQAKQMAFEMGFAPDPAKAEYAEQERRQEEAAYRAKMDRDDRHSGPVATEAQFAFIKKLIGERELDSKTQEYVDAARRLAVAGMLLRSSASKMIDRLKEQPYKGKAEAVSAPSRDLSDGIYVVPSRGLTDQIFKVYVAVHGSGQLCVKRLVVEPGANTGSFEYMGLASKHLPREATRMSLEQAKKFGAIYGFCVRCGRTLTDEESIAAGIGPICADKM